MATTRIMPLHIGKGRTESTAISDIIDYVANPQKTDNGRLVTDISVIAGSQTQNLLWPSVSIVPPPEGCVEKTM